jgi:predicted nuclease of predicted toxin-antitoxin system
MRFLIDECTGPAVAKWLRSQGHDVASIFEEARGITDDQIIIKALEERRILLTNDKDFGEMVFKRKVLHFGIVLLRLRDERSAVKINVLKKLLNDYTNNIPGHFVIVTEHQVRFASKIHI